MSYCSENKLPLKTSINRLFEIVDLLGFSKTTNHLKIDNQIGSFIWIPKNDEISYVGIEMGIYRENDCISVQMRTRMGRSYWDLKQQNKTISLLRAIFGGTFTTDEGNSRYMSIDSNEPSCVASSLFVCRWIFNNAMIHPKIYLNSRQLSGDLARKELSGFPWIDEMNPRILSDNMIIPYLIGSWESYFRSSYISILKYSDSVSENALKKCKLSSKDFLAIIKKQSSLEELLADSLSFQRPAIIAENFRQLNPSIDITGWLKKPYHRRNKTLFDSITEIINIRDSIVHSGNIDIRIMDDQIAVIINDLTAAVDRAYQGFGQVFEFTPDYSF